MPPREAISKIKHVRNFTGQMICFLELKNKTKQKKNWQLKTKRREGETLID